MDRSPIPVEGRAFVIASNGFAEGPAQALQRFLVDSGAAKVLLIEHPLVPEGPTAHRITSVSAKGSASSSVDSRLKPPLSFVLDPVIPLRTPKVDGWFGFNCLATGRGLVERRLGRATRVVHWSVDYVPARFGESVATRVYEALDKHCCRTADARVDLSLAALEARRTHYGLDASAGAHEVVVPMGAWLDRCPRTSDDAWRRRRVVFLGHLVERMGVEHLVAAVTELSRRGVEVKADIIGSGPLEADVRRMVDAAGVASLITVHGFVPDHADVERLLSLGAVAVAPYQRDPASFSRYADPGKLKAYLGAGLPILLTDVPPNAHDIATHGGGELVDDNGCSLADAIARLLDDPEEWCRRRAQAIAYSQTFDWPHVLDKALKEMGFVA